MVCYSSVMDTLTIHKTSRSNIVDGLCIHWYLFLVLYLLLLVFSFSILLKKFTFHWDFIYLLVTFYIFLSHKTSIKYIIYN